MDLMESLNPLFYPEYIPLIHIQVKISSKEYYLIDIMINLRTFELCLNFVFFYAIEIVTMVNNRMHPMHLSEMIE
jgi:hypothetical protein